MEKIPDKIDSKFRYVLLASHRAEQLMRGAQPKLDTKNGKITRVAMEEVLREVVKWEYGLEPEAEAAAAQDAIPDSELTEPEAPPVI